MSLRVRLSSDLEESAVAMSERIALLSSKVQVAREVSREEALSALPL